MFRVHQQRSHGKKGDRERWRHGTFPPPGGLTSKIHALVDAEGRPVTFAPDRNGQVADCARKPKPCSNALGEGDILLADKGYDSDAIRAQGGRAQGLGNTSAPKAKPPRAPSLYLRLALSPSRKLRGAVLSTASKPLSEASPRATNKDPATTLAAVQARRHPHLVPAVMRSTA